MSGNTVRYLTIGLTSTLLNMPAWASDLPQPVPPRAPVIASAPSFYVTSYIWASGINGRSATFPPLPAANINLGFSDVLKELNGAMMLAAEMRIDRWSFVVDGQFSQVTAGGNLPGPFFSSLKVRSQSTTIQASALYRAYTDANISLEVGGGIRFWNLNNKLEIQPGLDNLYIDHRQTEMWVDPTLGARIGLKLGGPWSLTLAGDIGGFGVGSRFSWQAMSTVNYAWNENWTLKAGYRALHVDYRNDGFLYDVTMHGPAIAATYRF